MSATARPYGLLLVSAVVATAIVAGLVVLGSPAEERARRLDDRRVRDLVGIKTSTDLYWSRHDSLPESLEALSEEPGVRINLRDPDDGTSYEYRLIDSRRYELCARFDGGSEGVSRVPERNIWNHGPGHHCFDLEAERMGRPRS